MKRVTKEHLPELLREKRGSMSQQEFADRFKVHRQTVTAWESGDYVPKPEILSELGIRVMYEDWK